MERVLQLLVSVLILAAGPVVAQDLAAPPPMPTAAEMAQASSSPQTARAQESLVIVPIQGGMAEEYRRNGQLYMVKVIPEQGYPYYLVDTDGDGYLETQRNDIEAGLLVPQWILFSW